MVHDYVIDIAKEIIENEMTKEKQVSFVDIKANMCFESQTLI